MAQKEAYYAKVAIGISVIVTSIAGMTDFLLLLEGLIYAQPVIIGSHTPASKEEKELYALHVGA